MHCFYSFHSAVRLAPEFAFRVQINQGVKRARDEKEEKRQGKFSSSLDAICRNYVYIRFLFHAARFAINDRYHRARDISYKIARLHARNNKRAKTILIAYLISLKNAPTMKITFEYQVKMFSATDVIRTHEFSQIALSVADRIGFHARFN